jgi:branched-chain amino acid transport system permease protein
MVELLAIQTLNGLQLGVLLFLMAAGLTLVLGIMNIVNLAHGSLYMLGAFFLTAGISWTGSYLAGLVLAIVATLLVGVALELAVLRRLHDRDHLDQVLATFGMILFFNEMMRILFGPAPLSAPMPAFLEGQVMLTEDLDYPIYRLTVIAVGLAVAGFLYWLIVKTRLGMLIRAGASNRGMIAALGVDVTLLYTGVFALGAALAGLAGLMAAPILSVESGMGDGVLILTFVVIVIGGIGSIRGAFVAALLIGLVDTIGRSFLPMALREFLSPTLAAGVGPAIASMAIYLLMALVLTFRPQGLFPARTG